MSCAEVEVRPIHKDEYAPYIELIDTFRPVGCALSSSSLLNSIEEIRKKGEILVLVKGVTIVGALTLLMEQKLIYNCCTYCHIEDVIVRKEFRGKGYGKILLKEALEYAKKSGCLKCVLNCAESKKQFYSNFGFDDRDQSCLSVWFGN